jgi:hypothetical protein
MVAACAVECECEEILFVTQAFFDVIVSLGEFVLIGECVPFSTSGS